MTDYQVLADNEIMKLVAKKDSQAFSVIYDRYSELLVNYFYKMLWQDREKAEDFMHDFFAKLIEKPRLYDTSRNFKTWMYSVANNMCKNEYRKQAVRSNTSNSVSDGLQVMDLNTDIVKTTDENKFSERLTEELNQLDDNQKTTFVLRYYQDMQIKEIAKTLNCSEGTVKSRLFYTLKKLSNSLREFSPQYIKVLIVIWLFI